LTVPIKILPKSTNTLLSDTGALVIQPRLEIELCEDRMELAFCRVDWEFVLLELCNATELVWFELENIGLVDEKLDSDIWLELDEILRLDPFELVELANCKLLELEID
jgi:hypothetical protein